MIGPLRGRKGNSHWATSMIWRRKLPRKPPDVICLLCSVLIKIDQQTNAMKNFKILILRFKFDKKIYEFSIHLRPFPKDEKNWFWTTELWGGVTLVVRTKFFLIYFVYSLRISETLDFNPSPFHISLFHIFQITHTLQIGGEYWNGLFVLCLHMFQWISVYYS